MCSEADRPFGVVNVALPCGMDDPTEWIVSMQQPVGDQHSVDEHEENEVGKGELFRAFYGCHLVFRIRFSEEYPFTPYMLELEPSWLQRCGSEALMAMSLADQCCVVEHSDRRKLAELEVCEWSSLCARADSEQRRLSTVPAASIYVRTLFKTMTIDVELKKNTIFDVKCLVCEKEGIPIENIRLRRHNSEQNIDDHTSTLFALDIQKEHMLKLHYHTDADCPLPFNEFSPSQWHPTFNALRAFNFIGEALWRDE